MAEIAKIESLQITLIGMSQGGEPFDNLLVL